MSPKRLSDLPGGSGHVRLDELVGQEILVLYAEKADSLQYGEGVRIEFQQWDAEKEAPGGPLLDAFSFAPGVRRAVQRIIGSADLDTWTNPEGVIAQVVKVGAGIALA
jgi:hypothetical protein